MHWVTAWRCWTQGWPERYWVGWKILKCEWNSKKWDMVGRGGGELGIGIQDNFKGSEDAAKEYIWVSDAIN